MPLQPFIVVLMGPTASGKTAASIQLAKRINAEIISADSIQVYRGLSIGSAKPTFVEREGIVHHLLDAADVQDRSFSVAEYQRLATACILDITARGKNPLIVGGTGLYINALTHPLGFTNVPGNAQLREQLRKQEEEYPGSLFEELLRVDVIRASHIHPNDTKRIVRALEIYKLSGKAPSTFGEDFANVTQVQEPFYSVQIGLTTDRALLYQRIDERVDTMLDAGLIEETIQFASFDPTLPALQGLGYKQLLQYLRGETTLVSAVECIKQETRRFAKRQITWFKRDQRIRWFRTDAYIETDMLVQDMHAHILHNLPRKEIVP